MNVLIYIDYLNKKLGKIVNIEFKKINEAARRAYIVTS